MVVTLLTLLFGLSCPLDDPPEAVAPGDPKVDEIANLVVEYARGKLDRNVFLVCTYSMGGHVYTRKIVLANGYWSSEIAPFLSDVKIFRGKGYLAQFNIRGAVCEGVRLNLLGGLDASTTIHICCAREHGPTTVPSRRNIGRFDFQVIYSAKDRAMLARLVRPDREERHMHMLLRLLTRQGKITHLLLSLLGVEVPLDRR